MNKKMNLKTSRILLLLLPLAANGIFVASTPSTHESSTAQSYQKHNGLNGRGLHEIMKSQLDYGTLREGGVKQSQVTSARVSDVVTSHGEYRRIRSCLKKKNGKRRKPSSPHFKNPNMPELIGSNQGHRVDLNCSYKPTCPKPKITWYKDNDTDPVVEREKSSGFSTISINRNKGLLTIMDNRRIDDGNYTCVVQNSYGTIAHTFKVHSEGRIIGAEPVLLPNQPGNHTVLTGSNLTLLCQMPYKGPEAQVDIRWFKHYSVDGKYINAEGKPFAENLQATNDKIPPLDDQKLELTNVTEKDSGFYTCVVKNPYGMAGSSGYVNVMDYKESDDVIAERSKRNTIVYLATSIGTVVGAILLTAALIWFCKFRKERQKKMLAIENARTVAAWTKKVMIERQTSGTESLLAPIVRIEKMRIPTNNWRNNEDSNTTLSEYEFQLDVDWEFPRELLHTCEELGEGAFGKVVRGLAHCSSRDSQGKLVITSEVKQPVTVAVKMLKEGHTDSDMIDLVKEMEMMKVIGTHVNIINLLGVCTQPQGRPLYVIVEFAPHGNLRDYLRARKPDTIQYLKTRKPGQDKPSPGSPQPISLKDMLSFGWQVSRGMEFLSQRRCVHRDLAARNVLVSDQGVVKIADFGMARDLHDSDYYRKVGEGKLPVKWMSPESLFQRVCTTQSDVWSFGILLWEIVTWGDSPYKTVASLDALMELLKAGCRMSKPPGCPSDVYSVMSRCWSYQPELRPQWSSLVSELHVQYLQTRPGEYLELTPHTLDTPPSSPESSTVGFGLSRQPSPGFVMSRQPGVHPSTQMHSPYAFQPSASISLDNNNYVFNDFRFQGTIPSYVTAAGDSVQPSDTHSYIMVPLPRNCVQNGIPPSQNHHTQSSQNHHYALPSPNHHNPPPSNHHNPPSSSHHNPPSPNHQSQPSSPNHQSQPSSPSHQSFPSSPNHNHPSSQNHQSQPSTPNHHSQPSSNHQYDPPLPNPTNPPSSKHHSQPSSRVIPFPNHRNQNPHSLTLSLNRPHLPPPLITPPASHHSTPPASHHSTPPASHHSTPPASHHSAPPASHPSSVTFPPRTRASTSISTPPSPRQQDPSIFFPPSPRYPPTFTPSAPMLSPVTPPNIDPASIRVRGKDIQARGSLLVTPPPLDVSSMMSRGGGFNPRDIGLDSTPDLTLLGLDSPPDSIPDTANRLSNSGSTEEGEGCESGRRGYGVSTLRCDSGYPDCGYANCVSEHGGSRVVLGVDTDPMWVGFNKYVDTGQRDLDTGYGYGDIVGGGSRQRGSSESGYGTTLETNSALSGRLPSESDSVFENEPEFYRRKTSLSNNYVKTGSESLQPLLKRL